MSPLHAAKLPKDLDMLRDTGRHAQRWTRSDVQWLPELIDTDIAHK